MWGNEPASSTSFSDKDIKDILVEGGLITAAVATQAEAFCAQNNTSFIDYLVTEGLVTKELVGETIAERLKVPYANLHAYQLNRELTSVVPAELAKKHRAVAFVATDKQITVATDDPRQANLVAEFKKIFPDKEIAIAYSLPEDITLALQQYRTAFTTRFADGPSTWHRILSTK